MLEEAKATDIYVKNIRQVFLQCESDTVFGQKDITEWLKCSKSKATNIMNMMKKAKIVERVAGLGPGKYKFVNVPQ